MQATFQLRESSLPVHTQYCNPDCVVSIIMPREGVTDLLWLLNIANTANSTIRKSWKNKFEWFFDNFSWNFGKYRDFLLNFVLYNVKFIKSMKKMKIQSLPIGPIYGRKGKIEARSILLPSWFTGTNQSLCWISNYK